MIGLRSLRSRLAITTLLVLIGAGLLLGWTAIGMGYRSEDRVLTARLELAANDHHRALADRSVTTATPVTGDRLIEAIRDPAERGDALGHALATLGPGLHEWIADGGSDGPADGHDYLVLVRDWPQHGRWWYVYQTTALESNAEEDGRRGTVLLLTIAAIALAGVVLAVATGRWLFRPLRQLELAAQARAPEDTHLLATSVANDEIGALATAFDTSHQRLQASLAREQDFARDASHELRTPVTVIEGAIDLLEADPNLSPRAQRAVARLRRSTSTMRLQIDAFLTLVREFNPDELDEVRLLDAVDQAIERNRTLAEERGISVQLSSLVDQTLQAPRAVMVVVLDNLLRNALTHGTGPHIDIAITGQRILITNYTNPDTVPSDPTAAHVSGSGSTGLGLAIVDGLCRRCQWQLDCELVGDEFTACVRLAPAAATAASAERLPR